MKSLVLMGLGLAMLTGCAAATGPDRAMIDELVAQGIDDVTAEALLTEALALEEASDEGELGVAEEALAIAGCRTNSWPGGFQNLSTPNATYSLRKTRLPGGIPVVYPSTPTCQQSCDLCNTVPTTGAVTNSGTYAICFCSPR